MRTASTSRAGTLRNGSSSRLILLGEAPAAHALLLREELGPALMGRPQDIVGAADPRAAGPREVEGLPRRREGREAQVRGALHREARGEVVGVQALHGEEGDGAVLVVVAGRQRGAVHVVHPLPLHRGFDLVWGVRVVQDHDVPAKPGHAGPDGRGAQDAGSPASRGVSTPERSRMLGRTFMVTHSKTAVASISIRNSGSANDETPIHVLSAGLS